VEKRKMPHPFATAIALSFAVHATPADPETLEATHRVTTLPV